MSYRICLLRYHDRSRKANWGGGATSLGLLRLLSTQGLTVSEIVEGALIVEGFGETAKVSVAASPHTQLSAANGWQPQLSPMEMARRLVSDRQSYPVFDDILRRYEACDLVVMNGEGDFILSPRITLWRSLVLMNAAILLGKPTFLVNSMLSRPYSYEVSGVMRGWLKETLPLLAGIALRDPSSLALGKRLAIHRDPHYIPDALFSLYEQTQHLLKQPIHEFMLEGLPPDIQELVRRQKYVVVSGSSRNSAAQSPRVAREELVALLNALKVLGKPVIVAATCQKDNWMLPTAKSAGFPIVPARVPLIAGLNLLARADLFISGRYHPSIMASLGGTPCVYFQSNSHKTAALSQMLNKPVKTLWATVAPPLSEPGATIEHPYFGDGPNIPDIVDEANTLIRAGSGLRDRIARNAASLAKKSTKLTDFIAQKVNH